MLKRGFSEDSIATFMISHPGEGATGPLEEALLWLDAPSPRPRDIFVYVVAHGQRSSDGGLMVEGEDGASISGRSMGEFLIAVGKMAPSARIAVFVSCCYSGLFLSVKVTEETTVITSTAADQEGWASQSGTVFFDRQFFRRWGKGEPVAEAFSGAVDACSFLDQTPHLRVASTNSRAEPFAARNATGVHSLVPVRVRTSGGPASSP
jgi:hypothetical protein